jgi:hypothetical protein
MSTFYINLSFGFTTFGTVSMGGGLNKSDTSIWNKFECVPYGIESTTFVNRNWFDTPIWNKFVTFVCYLE